MENSWEFNSLGRVEEILFNMLKQNTKKPKYFELLSPFKKNMFSIKCILLDINIILSRGKMKQQGQNETKGTKDQL